MARTETFARLFDLRSIDRLKRMTNLGFSANGKAAFQPFWLTPGQAKAHPPAGTSARWNDVLLGQCPFRA
jgi:hypothetical protein